MKKKSQSEIVGLAVLMIIITIGLLIFAVFVINNKPKSLINSFMLNEIPSYLNTAMLETNIVSCGDIQLKTLLTKCGNDNIAICRSGRDYCEEAKFILTEVLNNTLGEWKMDYRFFAYVGPDFTIKSKNIINPIYSTDVKKENTPLCKIKENGKFKVANSKSGIMFFPLNGGQTLTLKLDLCY